MTKIESINLISPMRLGTFLAERLTITSEVEKWFAFSFQAIQK